MDLGVEADGVGVSVNVPGFGGVMAGIVVAGAGVPGLLKVNGGNVWGGVRDGVLEDVGSPGFAGDTREKGSVVGAGAGLTVDSKGGVFGLDSCIPGSARCLPFVLEGGVVGGD